MPDGLWPGGVLKEAVSGEGEPLTMFAPHAIFWVHDELSMKKLLAFSLVLLLGGWLSAAADSGVDPLPDPISNNAVAMLKVREELLLFYLVGIGPKTTSKDVTNTALSMDVK
jgi:hypothetical protein